MSKNSEYVKKQRRKTKARMVESFGGICGICKQRFRPEIYDFHHINPQEKTFQFSKIRANCIAWKRIVKELRKCVMLCSNCHRGLHCYNTKLPDDILRFDEDYIDYKEYNKDKYISKLSRNHCENCGKVISNTKKYCSQKCSAIDHRKVDQDNIDLIKLMEVNNNNFSAVGRILNISDNAVRKRLKKLKSDQFNSNK